MGDLKDALSKDIVTVNIFDLLEAILLERKREEGGGSSYQGQPRFIGYSYDSIIGRYFDQSQFCDTEQRRIDYIRSRSRNVLFLFIGGASRSALEQTVGIGSISLKESLASGAATAGIRYLARDWDDGASDLAGSVLGLVQGIGQMAISPYSKNRDPRRGCGVHSPLSNRGGEPMAYGYRYDVGSLKMAGSVRGKKEGFSMLGLLKEAAVGGVMGGLAGTAFYGAGKAFGFLKDSVRDVRGKGSSSIIIEQKPNKKPQTYTSDLSNVTGKGARARNRAIQAIIKEDFPDLKLTYEPEYSPFIRTGVAQRNTGTQIGKNMFLSRTDLRDTIIHEELHHRWWKRGIIDHHPMDSTKEAIFYKTISAYKQMRGWN